MEYEEEDMLESAAGQAEEDDTEDNVESFTRSRLSCQIKLDKDHDGLEAYIPENLYNMLEVPLWMRTR